MIRSKSLLEERQCSFALPFLYGIKLVSFFFFQAEDGIRDGTVTGVQTCALPIYSIQVTPELLNDPQRFQQYQAAQGELTQALGRLMVVVENYPQLKSDQNFRDLQSQLEGTENRIAVSRNRYIQAVQGYNVQVRSFPSNLTAKLFGFQVKPNFTVANEQQIAIAPTVSFDTSTPGAPAVPPAAEVAPADARQGQPATK